MSERELEKMSKEYQGELRREEGGAIEVLPRILYSATNDGPT